MPDLGIIQTALDRAVTEGVFPGAVLAVRCGDRPVARFYAGHLSTVPPGSPVSTSTIYDLASLTKPLATVTALVLLMQKGSCRLDDHVADHLPECAGVSIGSAMIRHLLTHSSGLPGWRGFYERLSPIGAIPSSAEEREQAKRAMLSLIRSEAPVYERGTRSLYSDLGFILLGLIVERSSQQAMSDYFLNHIVGPLGGPRIGFILPERLHASSDCVDDETGAVAPTEVDRWRGHLLRGEVHDQNAAALGGEAGHAGLFGTADAVLAISGEWLRGHHGRATILDQAMVQEFTRRQNSEGSSSWALGWDTPSVPSSAGRYFAARSFGHLGYTGTSVWIDPVQELEVVLLSNRVHPSSRNKAIKEFRPAIHDLVYQEFIGSI
ncbi:MAG: beta-lactamase family protein [Nitrospira sp.]|jgi:CubicO group peptidase (beta-lactamase class C family)|nr:beta-lactamase family protein [Nitrospira sp.]MDI3464766.1 Beta-lactamase class C-like and penicillin binding proteins (PBPs) superfamily [Nitrospira sp.]